MSTDKPRISLTFPNKETFNNLNQQARDKNLSLSAYILSKLGIEPLKRGAETGNTRAKRRVTQLASKNQS